jgi:hypothetical protein
MGPEPDQPRGADVLRGAYQRARDDADAAHEAVGDAEDDLAQAERTLREHELQDGEDQLTARQAHVSAAEEAWHDRRHEAYEASQARDRAREHLDGAGPDG